MPTLTAHVPDELLTEVDTVAGQLDRSRAWVVKDALRQYLERFEVEARRWRETTEALAEVERGEVVPGEEVLAWLDTWGKPGERLIPPTAPRCS